MNGDMVDSISGYTIPLNSMVHKYHIFFTHVSIYKYTIWDCRLRKYYFRHLFCFTV